MSIFNELILPKCFEIQKETAKNFNNELKAALECFDKFEEELAKARVNSRSKAQNDKIRMTTLQSIHEDDDEPKKPTETDVTAKETIADDGTDTKGKRQVSKKRSKDEVEGMSSPEIDKRQKRNASVKAQSIISKQTARETLKELNDNDVVYESATKAVNVNLTQKLRRESSTDKSSRRRPKDDDKENAQPLIAQIKLEKVSLPPEPMDTEPLPVNVKVKLEPNKDGIAMPPPTKPVPKQRKAVQKQSSAESSEDESGAVKKRGTRGRKATETMPPAPTESSESLQKEKSIDSSEDESGAAKARGTRGQKVTNSMPPPPEPSARSTRASRRASSRSTRQLEEAKPDDEETRPKDLPDNRPKRTRGRKKLSATTTSEPDKVPAPQENGTGSPAEKPRPKRTRRAQKAAEKESQSSQEENLPVTKPMQIPPEKDCITNPIAGSNSPVLQKVLKPHKNAKKIYDEDKITKDEGKKTKDEGKKTKVEDKKTKDEDKKTKDEDKKTKNKIEKQTSQEVNEIHDSSTKVILNETRVIENGDMDRTMILPNGVYNHAPVTPKSVNAANVTVVQDVCSRETMVLDKLPIGSMDATVVLDKDPKANDMTDDNSLITDDSELEMHTPPHSVPTPQPTSAVKEKVQQFEELAARTTRTKTRAMAKIEEPDNHTPPDKIIKPVLSAETLNKMNNMIFNGKPTQMTSSASKPRVIPPPKIHSASTSKLSSVSRHRDAAEEAKREKEDARKKKEALLEAKREQQKKKREDKMAAAAAAREAAEKERKIALVQAVRERMEKQANADLGKLERLKEVERKKQELARKVAETEERRKAEEQARQQRLAEEQRKAEVARRKQLEEAEAIRKETALVAKEMEKRQKEYFEKKKLNKMHTPLKTPGTPGFCPQEPVHMADGFEHLNSDEESENSKLPVPAWSTHKMRRLALTCQSEVDTRHVDGLFSVRVHSVDLREIFPDIDRARLKRTSSAVWRTPPTRLPAVRE